MFNYNELIKRLKEGVIYAKYTGQHIAVIYVILNMNNRAENPQSIVSSIHDNLKSMENENITLFNLKENHLLIIYRLMRLTLLLLNQPLIWTIH